MIMKKDSLICFRASKDLHESLAKVANKNGNIRGNRFPFQQSLIEWTMDK
jgi:hypothetical protein